MSDTFARSAAAARQKRHINASEICRSVKSRRQNYVARPRPATKKMTLPIVTTPPGGVVTMGAETPRVPNRGPPNGKKKSAEALIIV